MDEELPRGKGREPEGGEIAAIDGFALRIGQRAALVPTPGAKVYGLVFSLTRSELDRLYSESSVQAYKPGHARAFGQRRRRRRPLLQPSTAAIAYRTQSRI